MGAKPRDCEMIRVTALVFILLNLFDMVCTLVAFNLGISEANPFLQGDTAVFVVKKVLLTALSAFLIVKIPQLKPQYENLIAIIAVTGCVVYIGVGIFHVVHLYPLLR